jgi:hypothetical protein
MPTVVIGNNTGDDYSGTEDTMLRSAFPDDNYGSNIDFNVQRYASGNHVTSLVRFTGLSSISSRVSVSSASLYIFKNGGNSNNNTITARALLRNWSESVATWNVYSTGNSWATAGGLSDGTDRSSNVSATIISGDTGEYKTFSSAQLAADVEGCINGDASNYGWHFERTDGSNDSTYSEFSSSNNDDGQRPYLSVTYTESGGTGNSYYYQQQQM